MLPSRIAAWTRRLGAAALLGVGLDHLDELTAGHYSAVPTIGTLFALNFAAAAVVAAGLLLPWRRALLAVAGLAIAGGSLVALLVSEVTPLFGFMEDGFRAAILLAIGLDVATLALLGAYVALRARA